MKREGGGGERNEVQKKALKERGREDMERGCVLTNGGERFGSGKGGWNGALNAGGLDFLIDVFFFSIFLGCE